MEFTITRLPTQTVVHQWTADFLLQKCTSEHHLRHHGDFIYNGYDPKPTSDVEQDL